MATVLYVAPHQDDETLSMGASIRRHLSAVDADGGPLHDVHVLLLTAGSGSGAQPGTGLDDVAFSRARDDEYTRACRALGVRFENIHFAQNRTIGDIALSVAEAKLAIVDFLADRPGAWVKTYSNRPCEGRHLDHVHTGQAVAELIDEGVLPAGSTRFYIEPWLISQFRAVNSVTIGTEGAPSVTWIRRAFDEYCLKDVVGGRLAIGRASVSYFDTLRQDPVNYWHAP